MKKIIWSIPLALFAISCSVEEPIILETCEPERVFARIESADESETRVYADENLKVLWDADDRISLFNKYTYNKQYRFAGETGQNSGEFEEVNSGAVITGNALDYVYAVYPYQAGTKISNDGVITLALPSEQIYSRDGSFGKGANTMVSATTNTELLFKNLCGYIVLKLYGEDVSVSSITLTGKNDEPLAGNVNVTAAVGENPSFAFSGTGSTSLTLTCPTPVTLGTTAEEATTFWFVVPPTTFSNGFTITVVGANGGTFEKSTSSEVVISRNSTFRMKALEVEIEESEPVAVDLGLSVQWASFNLGATQPEDYGDYFAWGETSTKQEYSWNSYIYGYTANASPDYGIMKYNSTDGLTTLELIDDAAHVKLGGNWRMPTMAELNELRNPDNCTWTWTTQNNVKGYLITSKKNGNSIFLPAAGEINNTSSYFGGFDGLYWTSSLSEATDAHNLDFTSSEIDRTDSPRFLGFSVRPVLGSPVSVSSITLSKNTLSLAKGISCTIAAIVKPDNAFDKTLIWSSSNPSIATVDDTGTIIAVNVGSAVITATANDGSNVYAECLVSVLPEMESVDLGLSVKWAACNLGATNSVGFGDFYAWGEISTKQEYSWDTYKYGTYTAYAGPDYGMTKYNSKDGLTVLDLSDDVANVKLGGNWRMPTLAEINELKNTANCTWTWTTRNNVKGYLITSKKNGNSIFLPAAGDIADIYGDYWCSSRRTDDASVAYVIGFSSTSLNWNTGAARFFGYPIRPVIKE